MGVWRLSRGCDEVIMRMWGCYLECVGRQSAWCGEAV